MAEAATQVADQLIQRFLFKVLHNISVLDLHTYVNRRTLSLRFSILSKEVHNLPNLLGHGIREEPQPLNAPLHPAANC